MILIKNLLEYSDFLKSTAKEDFSKEEFSLKLQLFTKESNKVFEWLEQLSNVLSKGIYKRHWRVLRAEILKKIDKIVDEASNDIVFESTF